LEAPLTQAQHFRESTFSSAWDFVMGLGETHLPTNLEVTTCIPNLKSLASAIAKILKGNSKILGELP